MLPRHPNKDVASRINIFLDWLDASGGIWYAPDMAAYRDFLLKEKPVRGGGTGLAATTVKAHLSTIRGRYEQILRDNKVRDLLYKEASAAGADSPADRKAFVDETLARLANAIHPAVAEVKTVTKQDHADSEHLRLNGMQADELLALPGIDTLMGLRDTGIIAIMLCTGIREAELCALNVDDLRQRINGELALRVRAGKGIKQRMIPYGPLEWCLGYVSAWLRKADIKSGAVFRGLYRGGKTVRKTRISTRGVNDIFAKRFFVHIEGVPMSVQPHDLRRTYARRAWEMGMDILRIQENLGHASLETTRGYIGNLDVEERRPPRMFEPPHSTTSLMEASKR